jgi:hypothetical protein
MYFLLFSTNTIYFLKLLSEICTEGSNLSPSGARNPILSVVKKEKWESE